MKSKLWLYHCHNNYMLQVKVKQSKFTLISAIIRNVLQSLKKEKKSFYLWPYKAVKL